MRKFQLLRSDSFSSKEGDRILIYAEIRTTWTEQSILGVACNIRALRDRIEKNGSTVSVLVLIPDKSSGYRDLIADPVLTRITRPHPLLATKEVNLARVDLLALHG